MDIRDDLLKDIPQEVLEYYKGLEKDNTRLHSEKMKLWEELQELKRIIKKFGIGKD